MVFNRTMARIKRFTQRVLLEYSYSSADIVPNMIKILFLQKFEVFLFFFFLGGGGGGGSLFIRYL